MDRRETSLLSNGQRLAPVIPLGAQSLKQAPLYEPCRWLLPDLYVLLRARRVKPKQGIGKKSGHSAQVFLNHVPSLSLTTLFTVEHQVGWRQQNDISFPAEGPGHQFRDAHQSVTFVFRSLLPCKLLGMSGRKTAKFGGKKLSGPSSKQYQYTKIPTVAIPTSGSLSHDWALLGSSLLGHRDPPHGREGGGLFAAKERRCR